MENNTTNNLKYKASKEGSGYKIEVNIRLSDDYGNGCEDFAITCNGTKKGEDGKWVDDFGGCAHDIILRHFPEFADFVTMHGRDCTGACNVRNLFSISNTTTGKPLNHAFTAARIGRLTKL